jgi:hypothetical protein
MVFMDYIFEDYFADEFADEDYFADESYMLWGA